MFLFLRRVVEHAGLVVHLSQFRRRFRDVQHRFAERRLAGTLVPNDRDVADAFGDDCAHVKRRSNLRAERAVPEKRDMPTSAPVLEVELFFFLVSGVLGIVLPLSIQLWDFRRLTEERKSTGWNTASWVAALYSFGPLSMLGWFWVT